MSGNEFEKKLQQKMGELKLPPSDAVWTNVEREIRKDKKRRRLILWLPLLLLFLGTGGWLAYLHHSTLTRTAFVPANIPAKAEPVDAPVQGANNLNSSKKVLPGKHKAAKDRTGIVKSNLIKQRNNNQATIQQNKVLPQSALVMKNRKHQVNAKKDNEENRLKSEKNAQQIESKNVEAIAKKNDSPKKLDNGEAIPPDSLIEINVNQKNELIPPAIVVKDSLQEETENKIIEENPSITKVKPKKSGKWQWGFVAGLASSKVTNGGISDLFNKSAMQDMASSGLWARPQARVYKSSSIQWGSGWSAGGFFQREFSERYSLSLGFRYSLFTTRITTGKRVDSTLFLNISFQMNNYYREGSSDNYVNRYHYIDLPLVFHAKLNHSHNMPLYWNVGGSISQLLSTNALHFDGSTGLYYQDTQLFNKTQFGMHSGFSIILMKNNKYPIELGPQLQYYPSNLLKHQASNKHILAVGLDLRWMIKK